MTVHGRLAAAPSYETARAAFIGRGRSPIRPAGDAPRGARRQRKARCSTRSWRSATPSCSSPTRPCACTSSPASPRPATARSPDRQVQRPPRRRARVRAVVDPQPGAAAPARRERGRHPALRAPRQPGPLLEPALRAPRSVLARNRAASRRCGPTASPATCRSCWCASPIAAPRTWCASSSRPTPTGASRACGRPRRLERGPLGLPPGAARRDPRRHRAAQRVRLLDRPGGIFVRRTDQIAEEDKVLHADRRPPDRESTATAALAEQIERAPPRRAAPPSPASRGRPTAARPPTRPSSSAPTSSAFNGHGGFTPDGREYVIVTTRDHRTPAPWVNVLANPYFGTVVSESGSAYTWCENAHNYRLTPWHNDPVGDAAARRSTSATRRRPLLVADPAARPAAAAVHHPPRLRLQRLRAARTASRAS
jgi:hypothetical protein